MAESLDADVAVVGAGPAGIAAAVRAAESRAEVLLIDEGRAPGGQIWRRPAQETAPPPRARRWLARLARSRVRRLRATAVGSRGPGQLLLDSDGRSVEVRYDALVIATGARELFLPFPGWTLPGVIGAGAAEALLLCGASMEGRRAIVAGSGPLLLAAAAALAASGAVVRTIAEQTPWRRIREFLFRLPAYPGKLADALRYGARLSSARYRTGTWVAAARGGSSVAEVVLTDGVRTWTEPCDVLCCGFGLVANVELARLLGCVIEEDRVVVDQKQRTSVPGVFCAGEVTGIGGVDLALVEGEIAGLASAGANDDIDLLQRTRTRHLRFAAAMFRAFAPRVELRALAHEATVICRCEDVPLSAFDPGWSARQAKLYTRAGMGPCQGRICGPVLRFLFGWDADTVRLPLSPVSMSVLQSAAGCGSAEEARVP